MTIKKNSDSNSLINTPSATGTEAGTLTAKKCEGKWAYDGTDCGSPLHPNKRYCARHRLEYADKVLDAYHDGSLNREDAEKKFHKIAKNWEDCALR